MKPDPDTSTKTDDLRFWEGCLLALAFTLLLAVIGVAAWLLV